MKYLKSYELFEQAKPPIEHKSVPRNFGDGILSWLFKPKKKVIHPNDPNYDWDAKSNDPKFKKLQKSFDEADKKGDKEKAGKLAREMEKRYDKMDKDEQDSILNDFLKELKIGRKATIEYYRNWFNKQETQNKFKNKQSMVEIKKLLDNIKVYFVPWISVTSVRDPVHEGLKRAEACVFVPIPNETKEESKLRKKRMLSEKESKEFTQHFAEKISPSFKWNNFENVYWLKDPWYNRISQDNIQNNLIHEIGHLIDFKLSQLGENALSDYFNQKEDSEREYVSQFREQGARLRVFRKYFNLNPMETAQSVVKKIINGIKNGQITLYFNVEDGIEYKSLEIEGPLGVLLVSEDKKKLVINDYDSLGLGDNEVLTPAKKFNVPELEVEDGKMKETSVEMKTASAPKLIFGMKNSSVGSDISALLSRYTKIEDNTLIIDIEELVKEHNKIAMNQKDSVASKTA